MFQTFCACSRGLGGDKGPEAQTDRAKEHRLVPVPVVAGTGSSIVDQSQKQSRSQSVV